MFAFIAVFGILVTNAVTYYLMLRIQREHEAEVKFEVLKSRLLHQTSKILETNELYTQMQILRHDLQNRNMALLALIKENRIDDLRDEIENNMDRLENSRRFIKTGYSTIDGILNTKLTHAEKMGIETRCDAKIAIGKISEMDVSLILGNLLDNALEYYERCPRIHQKSVRVKLSNQNEMLMLRVSNRVAGSVLEENKDLKSTKADRRNHGFGMQSVKNIIEEYHGVFDRYESDGFFHVQILLNL